jgi:hypothetical protein
MDRLWSTGRRDQRAVCLQSDPPYRLDRITRSNKPSCPIERGGQSTIVPVAVNSLLDRAFGRPKEHDSAKRPSKQAPRGVRPARVLA